HSRVETSALSRHEGTERTGIGASRCTARRLLEGFCADVVHDEVTATVLWTARAFEGLGVLVEPRDGRGIEDARRVWMDVCTPEFADAHPLLKDPERRRLVSAQVVEWLERGEAGASDERE